MQRLNSAVNAIFLGRLQLDPATVGCKICLGHDDIGVHWRTGPWRVGYLADRAYPRS
jgi:hypothetical protein